MFCPNCGSEIQEGTNFCANCGEKLNDTNAAAPEQPAPAPAAGPAAAAPTTPPAPEPQPAPPSEGAVPLNPAPTPAAPQAATAKQPWYGKTWVIILFLIFLWPVGLIFMWLKSCSWKRVAKICVTVGISLLVIFNIAATVSIFNALNTIDTTPQTQTTPKSDNKTDKGTTNNSKQGNKSGTKENPALAAVPTLYELINLSGKDVVGLLDQEAFKFEKGSEYQGWLRDEHDAVIAAGVSETFNATTLSKQDALAKSSFPYFYRCQFTNYKTLEDCVAAGKVSKEKSAYSTDGSQCVLILKGANGGGNVLMLGTKNSNGVKFSLYNDAYVSTGLLDDYLDGKRTAQTVQQFWTQYMETHSSKYKLAG